MGGSVTAEAMDSELPTGPATKVLVLANETVTAPELLGELRRIDADGKAEYFVCVPANPVDTGQAEQTGAAFVWEATVEAAQRRLDETLATLASNGLRADGAARRLPAADRAHRGGPAVRPGPDRDLHPQAGALGLAGPGPGDQGPPPVRRAGDAHRRAFGGRAGLTGARPARPRYRPAGGRRPNRRRRSRR